VQPGTATRPEPSKRAKFRKKGRMSPKDTINRRGEVSPRPSNGLVP
jgi:hypothetical protein